MKAKQKLQRFLSIFLACVMIMNVPMPALAFDDVQILDVVEEVETVAEEELTSEDIVFTDGEETVEEIAEPEEQVLDNSPEVLEDAGMFEDGSPELGEGIEIIGIEEVMSVDTMELAAEEAVEAELPFTLTVGGEEMTEFVIGEVTDPYNGTKPLYIVTIPEGSTEAVITWAEGTYTISYYHGNTNEYIGMNSGHAASKTVPTDYNSDGVYDKIQVYDSGWGVPYWIAFTNESAEPEDTTYDVIVNAAENGTVTADPTTAAAGTEVTLTVAPAEGFELDTLTVMNGEEEVTVTDNKFTMPEGNVIVSATFKAVEAELPFNLTVGGEEMTEFVIGEVADPYNGTKPLYIVTIPEGSTEAVITWAEGTYTISYYHGNTNEYIGMNSGHAASKTVPTDYNSDGVYDKIQVYDSGWGVPYWIAFTNESAEPEDTTYDVIVNAAENGTVTAEPTTAAAGTEVTLTVTPAEGFELDTLTVMNGEEEVAVTDNKFTMPEGDVTVSATFKAIETSEEESVTIYMSVNQYGDFITATDGTVMALEEMTVPYFDLALYGLEGLYYNPYCYVDENGNTVTQTAGTKEDAENVVTLLHLFIWATEVYCNGLDPADAGQGWLAQNGWNGFNVYDQTPGSAFINFWTFGSNLNYYLNYEYPLGRPGWGSTCDQIALADGDIVSVRYNADTGNDGAYYHFGSTGDLSKSTTQVNDVVLTMYQCTESLDYTTGHARVGEGKIVYVGPTVNPADAVAIYTTDANSQITVETSELEGSYYVFSDTWDPAVMYLTVIAASHSHNYTPVVTDPTCEEEGYTTYTCSCGDSYESDFVDATGHNFVDGVCSCGEKETVIPEGARFINVTTDVTGATIVEDQGIHQGLLKDYSMEVPYYHLVIPEGAKFVYITYPAGSIMIDQWNYSFAYAMPLPFSWENMGSNMSPAVVTNADGTHTVSILVKDYITQIPDDGTGIIMYNENYNFGEMFTIGYQIEEGYYDVSIPSSERYTVTGETIAKDGYTFNVSINEGYIAGEEFAVKVNGETVATKPGDVTVASVTKRLIIAVEGVLLEPKDPNCFITVDLTGYNGTIDSNSSISYEGPDIEWTYDKNHGLVPGESKTYQFHSDEMYCFSIVLDLPYNDGAILGWEVNGEQCLYTGSYKQYDLPAEGNDDAVGYMQRINYTWDGVTYDYLQFECRFGKSGDIDAPGTWVLKPILTPEGYVANMINALPAIDQLTTADADKVEAARAAYDALTEEQKALVSEEVKAALEAAEAKIAELKKAEEEEQQAAAENQAKADAAANAVAALPAVDKLTAADAEKVESARAAYDALTDAQKELVSEEVKAALEAAEAKIAELKEEAEKEQQAAAENQAKADAAANAVAALPAVDKLTAADAEKVEAARAAYDALTAEQKALVSADALKQLEAAEAKIAELTHVHTWDAGTVVSEATVSAAEVRKFTCTGCKETKTESVGEALEPVLEIPGKLSSFNIKKGKTAKFEVTMANGDSVSSVKSSKTKILKASLDKKTGKITVKGLKKGTSKLTIKLASGKTRTYTVKVVTGTVKTTGLSVSNVTNKKLTLNKGKTKKLTAVVKPFTSTQKVTYKSSNKKLATVTSSGKVKAVAPGKATITVTSGSKKVKITVTVPGITNVKSSVSVKKNKTLTLKPKTYGISEKVTYTSSNTKVATVTSSGKIKGIKKGTAKITIQAGTFKKTVTVKVK